MPNRTLAYFIGLLLFSILLSCADKTDTIAIFANTTNAQLDFGVKELISALSERGFETTTTNASKADIIFTLDGSNEKLRPEGFEIRKDETITIQAHDAAGLLYGALELAEQIKTNGWEGVEATQQNPYMQKRGTKLNIPLDARTPSYTDASDVAQHNIPVMWEFDFWKGYIDNLARHRYNFISLWSLHPFLSLVKVPGYEDIALDDVHRATIDWEEYYHLHGTGLATSEILKNAVVIKKISIAEKIEFWKKVMRYAKERNIDFYIMK